MFYRDKLKFSKINTIFFYINVMICVIMSLGKIKAIQFQKGVDMFAIHGDWRVSATDNYVLQWFSGCWNEEAAVVYSKDFLEKTAHLNGTKWAILSFFDDWELGTPDIEPHVIEHCQRFIQNGCIKDCHVYTPTASKKMQLENMIPVTQGNYERRVFIDVKDAITWLKECQFEVDVTDFVASLPK